MLYNLDNKREGMDDPETWRLMTLKSANSELKELLTDVMLDNSA